MANTANNELMTFDLWRDIIMDGTSNKTLSAVFKRFENPDKSILFIRTFHPAASVLETVGLSSSLHPTSNLTRKTTFSAYLTEKLLQTTKQNPVIDGSSDSIMKTWPGLLPPELNIETIAAPLFGTGIFLGVLIFGTRTSSPLPLPDRALFISLIEPYILALEKYRHARELILLREASEADRKSLLAKLERQDISESIIGAETGLKSVMERVELVSRSETPVLLLGETGSGKEVVARAVHSKSRRSGGPFLRVNCGAIPPELVDSQLFGHERGSFSGAHEMRKGWFERADGGTLFLDEVGELPLAAQVRLLRILQDGTFERVGGQKQLFTDVRIIAATHRDMNLMVHEGSFRDDLWYRLAIFPIEIPPLRNRPEDIPPLATHYAVKASKRLGSLPLHPTPDDLRLLVSYPWPGNVRELAAVIERAVILGNGKRLDLGRALGMQGNSIVVQAQPLSADFQSLDQAIRNHIECALEKTHGKIEGSGGAATLLQINPHTLRARMRKLGIKWQEFRG